MSDGTLRVTTEEQRDRLHPGRRVGAMCGACGRTLGADETIYWERFFIDIDRTAEPGLGAM